MGLIPQCEYRYGFLYDRHHSFCRRTICACKNIVFSVTAQNLRRGVDNHYYVKAGLPCELWEPLFESRYPDT